MSADEFRRVTEVNYLGTVLRHHHSAGADARSEQGV